MILEHADVADLASKLGLDPAVAEKAIAAGIAPADRFTTIYSGMELDWFLNAKVDAAAVRRELGIPEDAPVVGKIARLFSLKGHDQLFDAICKVADAHPGYGRATSVDAAGKASATKLPISAFLFKR